MATGIYWPAQLPCWLLENHEGQYEDIYARTEVCEGPARLRRMYMAVPQIRKAEIFLHFDPDDAEKSESTIFHEFFEQTLDVGARRFMCPFKSFTGGIRYYECEFAEPWEAEFVLLANAKRAWRVQVKFRLYGDGIIVPTDMDAAEFEFRGAIHLKTKGALETRANMSIDFPINLFGKQGVNDMAIDFPIALKGHVVPSNEFSIGFMIALAGSG